jgi:threonine dehydratase
MKHTPVTVAEARQAHERISNIAVRTPLLRVETDSRTEVYLKLENLQPIGSFKIRGAASKLMGLDPAELRGGVWTASAGNMAQGAAWCARHLGVAFTAIVPDTAPATKVAAIERLGGRVRKVPRETYFEVFTTRKFAGQEGMFIHAFSDQEVMAGNATIGLEILEDLPGVRAIYVPYGGGGLSCGIASVIRELSPSTEVITCEPDTAAPLEASLAAGKPTDPPFCPTWIDGAGGAHVFPEMFVLAQTLISRASSVTCEETAAAVRFLAGRAHVVAEGAGALALAAATKDGIEGQVVCVVSGGNIDAVVLSEILAGHLPVG